MNVDNTAVVFKLLNKMLILFSDGNYKIESVHTVLKTIISIIKH